MFVIYIVVIVNTNQESMHKCKNAKMRLLTLYVKFKEKTQHTAMLGTS